MMASYKLLISPIYYSAFEFHFLVSPTAALQPRRPLASVASAAVGPIRYFVGTRAGNS